MSGDNLTIALFLLGTAITLAVTAITLAGWTGRPIVTAFFGLAALFFLIAVLWPSIGDKSKSLKSLLLSAVSNNFAFGSLALCLFVILFFDFAIKMGWIGAPRTVLRSGAQNVVGKTSDQARYAANITLLSYREGINPLMLLFDATATIERLSIVLDYSVWANDQFWTKRRSVPLVDIHGVFRGRRVDIPIVSHPQGQEHRFFSISPKVPERGEDMVNSGKYRIRIRFIGDAGKEQSYYFIMHQNQPTEKIMIFPESDFAFIAEWAAEI
jgi:hypothetical protein